MIYPSGSNIDLVGLQGGDLSNPGASSTGTTGGSITAGNGNFVGNFHVQGQANFSQSVGVTGTLAVGGQAIFQTATNSSSAVQMQNASGSVLFNVDTSQITYNGGGTNLISVGDFEGGNLTNWSVKNGGTMSIVSTQAWQGNNSLQMVSSNSVGDGDVYSVTLTPTTQYTLSFYAKVASSSINDITIGRQDQSGTDIDNGCSPSGQNLTFTTTWTRFTCTFTTGGTISGSNIYIKKTNGGSSDTYYIDGVQLIAGSSAATYTANGALQLLGVINSPTVFQNKTDSTAAFQIQNATGNSYILVDTSGANLYLGNLGIASTIQLGNTTGAVAQTINIGNNGTASSSTTIVIGSTVAGNVTLQSAGSIVFKGHISTANISGSTTIAAGAAANCVGNSPTVSISGNDEAGTVTITTDATGPCTAGLLATITYANSNTGGTPRILLTPANNNGSALQYYNNSSLSTGFTVDTNNAPTAATTYKYNYWIIQ